MDAGWSASAAACARAFGWPGSGPRELGPWVWESDVWWIGKMLQILSNHWDNRVCELYAAKYPTPHKHQPYAFSLAVLQQLPVKWCRYDKYAVFYYLWVLAKSAPPSLADIARALHALEPTVEVLGNPGGLARKATTSVLAIRAHVERVKVHAIDLKLIKTDGRGLRPTDELDQLLQEMVALEEKLIRGIL